ncbi:DUF2637 domain-containing protein [Nocardia salmonicida]|uniref:DUF2637 domain-containing protein n=1 Tax=Nocardia salmonicida TaxID=53431 RepID=UPI00340CA66C
MSTADQQPKSVRWARWSAVLIVLVIGGAAFVLSFAALRDLAIRAHTPKELAWLFPVIVDGTIIQATIAVLALADSPERSFFTRVLIAGATVSIGGNIAHALVSGHGALAAILAVIAPAALLLDTHGLAVLLRAAQRVSAPIATGDPVAKPADDPAPDVVPAVTKPVPALSPVQTFHTPPRPVAPLLPVAVPIPTGGN